jgi:chromosomal replication initiator protein
LHTNTGALASGRALASDEAPDDRGLPDGLGAHSLWQISTAELRGRLSEGNFSAWFGRAQPAALEGDTLVLGVPTKFTKDWIERNYLHLVEATVSAVAGRSLRIAIETDNALQDREDTDPDPVESPPAPDEGATGHAVRDEQWPHPKYTFDSFVIGSSNRFAHAAAQAVAEAPAQSYNPLFVYAGAGLGKTHLLHAIGRYVRDCHPELVTRYVSTEQFMNEFIAALQGRTIPGFHRRFRAADVLLVDDIQFLEGK